MGVDVDAHSGIAIAATQLVGVIVDSNKEMACRTLLVRAAQLFQSLKSDAENGELEDWERQQKRESAKFMTSHFRSLSIDSSVDDVREMLLEMAPPIVDGFDSYVSNEAQALAVWAVLIESLFPGAPSPDSTLCIGSPRYQGNWELPQAEALFVFSEDECFERIKSRKGKQLDSMLGTETRLSSWSSYSC